MKLSNEAEHDWFRRYQALRLSSPLFVLLFLLLYKLNILQTQNDSVGPATVIVKTLSTFDRDFQSACFLFKSRADIVSWGELLSAMLLPQNPDFSFGSRFELFQEYFFSLGSAPLSAAFWVVVGELSEKGI